jgi:hypothetical protein
MTPDVLLGWIVAVFIGLLGLVVLGKIIVGQIKLDTLIADQEGYASMSRFQFLVFTFVVAGGLAYLVLGHGQGAPQFPTIPEGVLILLGISGGSYAIGKGIDRQTPATSTTPPKANG